MGFVAFLALIFGTIFGVIQLIKKNKSDKLERRHREIELERKELELQKMKDEVRSKKDNE